MKRIVLIIATIRLGCVLASGHIVPTAAEYVQELEGRFLTGAAVEEIRNSFETNRLFAIYEILPYCYEFSVDTNNIESTIGRYLRKLEFIESLLTQYSSLVHLSSNIWESSVGQLENQEMMMQREILRRYEENPTDAAFNYWKGLYPRAIIGHYSGPVSRALIIRPTPPYLQSSIGYVGSINRLSKTHSFNRFLNLGNYDISRADLYAELSTNATFNADAMFRYCLTERADFPTNSIAIAEKEIWRNNFVLEIVAHSCNLHTNDANRALDAAYTNQLATLRGYYEALPADATDIFGTNRVEWLQQLGSTIDAYTQGISPFFEH